MLGNDRLYLAVLALATAEGDARQRVCLAMRNIDKLNENEFNNKPDLWRRIEALKLKTTIGGAQVINGRFIRDAYEFTALMRRNSTYSKYAKEIVGIWLETCE